MILKTLTIAIPACNESGNILSLLSDIKKFSKSKFNLKKIVVVSDGSTDDTVLKVRSLKDSSITINSYKERKGVAYRQNEIMSSCTTDYLLMLNADIRIKDADFLRKISEFVLTDHIDLTAVRLTPVAASNWFEKIIYVSVKLKNEIFEKVDNGKNLFTCHGTVRLFSQRLYKTLRFSGSVNEDAYSYLYCQSHGYKYGYITSTEAYYRLPDNFDDHQRQSMRFLSCRDELNHEFGKSFVASSYYLNKNIVNATVLKYLKLYPMEIFAYSVVSFMIKVNMFIFPKAQSHTWDLATSTKSVNITSL